jgi:hypothetical protein
MKVAKNIVDNSRGKKNLIKSGWGDENILEEDVVNLHYDDNIYHNYRERTRQNLVWSLSLDTLLYRFGIIFIFNY